MAEELVTKAKLAESAERYDDMAMVYKLRALRLQIQANYVCSTQRVSKSPRLPYYTYCILFPLPVEEEGGSAA